MVLLLYCFEPIPETGTVSRASSRAEGRETMDEARLRELLEEAIVDCYGEDEEFAGILCTLGERLSFPLKARVLGEVVEVVGLDDRQSDLRRGIVAQVRKAGQEYSISLADLEFVDSNVESAEWLEMYRHWLKW